MFNYKNNKNLTIKQLTDLIREDYKQELIEKYGHYNNGKAAYSERKYLRDELIKE